MKKTFKVVMLPTTQMSYIHLCPWDEPANLAYFKTVSETIKGDSIAQHLYIISDDQIKEGEILPYIMCWKDGSFELNNSTNRISDSRRLGSLAKKIVATTDKLIISNKKISLAPNANEVFYLPQLPESFIQAYIKAYNEGKPITEVDLEINESSKYNLDELRDRHLKGLSHTYDKSLIKTRSDNTVIVHQSKMYTREEVIAAIIKYNNDFINFEATPLHGFMDTAKWIDENL